MAREALGCRSESKVPDEMRRIMRDKSELNNEDMADEILKFLSDKYTGRKWFVFVYNEVLGFQKHCMSSEFHTVFRESGKNAAAYSSSYPLDDLTRDVVMRNFHELAIEVNDEDSRLKAAKQAYNFMNSANKGISVLVAVVVRFVDLRMTSYDKYFLDTTDKFTVIAVPVGLPVCHLHYYK